MNVSQEGDGGRGVPEARRNGSVVHPRAQSGQGRRGAGRGLGERRMERWCAGAVEALGVAGGEMGEDSLDEFGRFDARDPLTTLGAFAPISSPHPHQLGSSSSRSTSELSRRSLLSEVGLCSPSDQALDIMEGYNITSQIHPPSASRLPCPSADNECRRRCWLSCEATACRCPPTRCSDACASRTRVWHRRRSTARLRLWPGAGWRIGSNRSTPSSRANATGITMLRFSPSAATVAQSKRTFRPTF